MRHLQLSRLSALACLLLAVAPGARGSWKLRWADEFDGPAGSPPNPANWTYDLGKNNGWGNNESESYTDSRENSRLDGNGRLVIRALASDAGYTSARLKTQGLFSFQYGRVEARMKLPSGAGIWPAFWMLGANIDSAGWPDCGEIDVMELKGNAPTINYGSIHGPGYSGGKSRTMVYQLPRGGFDSGFHIFGVEWSAGRVAFYVDGVTYAEFTRSSIPQNTTWAFDHPFFLLLNVAVGGNFVGAPNADTVFPQELTVDYVRVYEDVPDASPAPKILAIEDAASGGLTAAPGSVVSVFGENLSDGVVAGTFDFASGVFALRAAGASVYVNGLPAALTFVSPSQINFQIPWETSPSGSVRVDAQRGGVFVAAGAIDTAETSPAIFSQQGVAVMVCSSGAPVRGASCSVWGNGFGPTNPPQVDGLPTRPDALAWAASRCAVAIEGVSATVTFCGLAPGTLIYQLDFVFPEVAQPASGKWRAVMSVAGASVSCQLSSVS